MIVSLTSPVWSTWSDQIEYVGTALSDKINQKGWVAFFVLLVLESCIDRLGKAITLKFPYTGSAVSFQAVVLSCRVQNTAEGL